MNTNWKLLDLRARVRRVDTQLVVLLARRFELMNEIREWKLECGIPLLDAARERDILAHCTELGESLGVPGDVIETIFNRLFEELRGNGAESALMNIKAGIGEGAENCEQAPGCR